MDWPEAQDHCCDSLCISHRSKSFSLTFPFPSFCIGRSMAILVRKLCNLDHHHPGKFLDNTTLFLEDTRNTKVSSSLLWTIDRPGPWIWSDHHGTIIIVSAMSWKWELVIGGGHEFLCDLGIFGWSCAGLKEISLCNRNFYEMCVRPPGRSGARLLIYH